jgi:hypothetical protein
MPVVVTTQEVDIRKIMVSGQHEKGGEVGKIPSQLIKSGMVAPACHSSFAGSINRIQASLSISVGPYPRNN